MEVPTPWGSACPRSSNVSTGSTRKDVEAIACLLSLETTTLAGRYVKLRRTHAATRNRSSVPMPRSPSAGRTDAHAAYRSALGSAVDCLPDSLDQWRDLERTLVAQLQPVSREASDITCSVNVSVDPDLGIWRTVAMASACGECQRRPGRHEPAASRPEAGRARSARGLRAALLRPEPGRRRCRLSPKRRARGRCAACVVARRCRARGQLCMA